MRLDYSDKMKAVRESTERPRPVQKNRPRKEPIGTFALVGLLLLVAGYGAGVLTGWVLFKGKQDPKAVAAAQAASQAKPQAAPAAQASAPTPFGQPGQPGQPAPEVPLTFYKTLPSGGKGAMGSGINTKLPEVQSKASPAAQADPAAVPAQAKGAAVAAPTAKASEAKPADHASAGKAPSEKGADKTQAEKAADKPAAEKQASESRYLVQVASYKDKKEAEAVRSKLVAKGIAAYTLESKLPDKGVWYRIRVGRHLSRQEAQQLAGKVGSGATVVAE